MNRLLLSLAFFVLPFTALFAQQVANGKTKPFILGVTEAIHSRVLAEDRRLNVYLPDTYKQADTARYPVLYLLDGSADEDFIHIVGLVQFLTMIQAMPPTIVIGIANVDRKRDFTFPTTIDSDRLAFPTTGHSAKFISFLEHEVQPYVKSHYRTTNSKTIVGQSLGGLLATEVLLTKPGLFTAYIIVSPSLWWDHESLFDKFPSFERSLPGIKRKVYISVGSEGKQMEDDAKLLADRLSALKQKDMEVYFAPLPEENHLTILHNSAYKGLLLLNKAKH